MRRESFKTILTFGASYIIESLWCAWFCIVLGSCVTSDQATWMRTLTKYDFTQLYENLTGSCDYISTPEITKLGHFCTLLKCSSGNALHLNFRWLKEISTDRIYPVVFETQHRHWWNMIMFTGKHCWQKLGRNVIVTQFHWLTAVGTLFRIELRVNSCPNCHYSSCCWADHNNMFPYSTTTIPTMLKDYIYNKWYIHIVCIYLLRLHIIYIMCMCECVCVCVCVIFVVANVIN